MQKRQGKNIGKELRASDYGATKWSEFTFSNVIIKLACQAPNPSSLYLPPWIFILLQNFKNY
jgi:hypothetical protein